MGPVLRGRGGAAYGPFVEALGEYARTAAPDALRAELGLGAAPLARLVPVLRERLPDIPEPVALQPDEERARLFDAVTQLLIAMAARTPVVLVLDDLHWADAASVALLRHVARFAPRHRLLLLGAYRDVEVTRAQPLADALGALPRETAYEHVALAGLEGGEVGQLLEAVADQAVPAALVTAITTETSGNPFFIREVLLHLVEEGKLVRRDGQWTADVPIAALGIPESVRQVIQRRLARLSASANRWLRAAAGFAASFRFDLASRVAGLDEPDALDALDEVLAAQLVQPAGDAESFDFAHALVRHTLYAELSPPRRVRLHRQIAETMEHAYGVHARDYAGEIARHYQQSVSLPGAERGVPYCLVAVEHAEASAAFAEAAAYLRMALELSPTADVARPRLLARLALAHTWSLALEQAEQTALEAARAIAAVEGNDAAAEFVADACDAMWVAASTRRAWSLAAEGLRYLGSRRDTTWARFMVYDIERREATDPEFPGIPVDSPERREVTARLWELPAFRHPTQQMFAYVGFRSREDVLARAGTDPTALIFWAADYRKALPLCDRAAAIALDQGRIALAIYYLTIMARAQTALGDLASSMATYTRALTLCERIDVQPWLHPFIQTVFFSQTVVTGVGSELVLAVAESRLDEDAEENRWTMAGIRAVAAWCAAHLGRADDALHWLRSILPWIERAPGSTMNYVGVLAMATHTLDELDRTDHLEVLERNIREKWLRPDFRYVLTDSRFALALLSGLRGRYEEAVELFAQARAIFDEQGSAPMCARLDYYEARMYLRRDAPGDRERAATLLRTALERLRALGLTGWAERAEQMLATATSSETPIDTSAASGADAPAAPLTPPPPVGRSDRPFAARR